MKGRTMLPKNAVIEFQSIYQKEFGIVVTFEQALQKAEDFIQLFDLVIQKPKQVEKEDEYGQT